MDIYQESNDSTRFDFFDHHHPAVIKMLTQKAIEQLAHHRVTMVLGAGNCNDIPLDLLLETFDTVVLVDVDETALDFACNTKIGSPSASKLTKIVTDLTGIHSAIKQLTPPITDEQIDSVLNQIVQPFPLSSPLIEWQGRCDLVLSIGVVSQLVDPLIDNFYQDEISRSSQTFIPMQNAVADQHFNQIRFLCSPIGIGILVFERYSSKPVAQDPPKMKQYLYLLSRVEENTTDILNLLQKPTWTPCRMRGTKPLLSLVQQTRHDGLFAWPWIFNHEQIYLMMGWLLRFESMSS